MSDSYIWTNSESRTKSAELLDMYSNITTNSLQFLHLVHLVQIDLSIMSVFMLMRTLKARIEDIKRNYNALRRLHLGIDQFGLTEASSEEINEQEDDRCAVCLEGLDHAKKLPCGHLFHAYVLTMSASLILD